MRTFVEFLKYAVYPAVVCLAVGYTLTGLMWMLIDRFGR